MSPSCPATANGSHTHRTSRVHSRYTSHRSDGEQRTTVTKDGGGQPRWRADGKKLYYRLPLDNSIMSVDVRAGADIQISVPRPEARPVVNTDMTRNAVRHQLGVLADGTRFLVRVPPATAARSGTSGGSSNGITLFFSNRGQGIPATNIRGGGAREAGRGGGSANSNINGLTVLLNWTNRLQKRNE